ncbi:MAG: long-chain fatty acid--CoA ligase, partial [Candidatus Cloacimonetes bacterium]|nr:long-chain fatty acid--CoA ligase [Candidatus Cloacimonadota bacterium]
LGPSGKNIYPEEIEAKLNNLQYIAESIVVDRDSKLVALVYPDYETADKMNIEENEMKKIMENNRIKLNKILPEYMKIVKVEISSREFEKTPKKSIKRYLYTRQ